MPAQGQALAVHVGATALPGIEKFVGDGVVSDAQAGLALPQQGDGDGEDGQAIDEVGGAVDGIDAPHVPVARLQGGFLFGPADLTFSVPPSHYIEVQEY